MEITNVMQVIMALPALIVLVRELMKAAQDAMGAGTGAEKKKTVLEGIAAIIGNAEIWQKVQGIFSILVDVLAMFKPKTS